ncbi:MAG: hypothetical protein LBQ90_12490 [Synergistaceae bacterium]|nr:hypothetical protein [Synergistaceae bacterium]
MAPETVALKIRRAVAGVWNPPGDGGWWLFLWFCMGDVRRSGKFPDKKEKRGQWKVQKR